MARHSRGSSISHRRRGGRPQGHRRRRRLGPLRVAVFLLGIAIAAIGARVGIGLLDSGDGKAADRAGAAGATATAAGERGQGGADGSQAHGAAPGSEATAGRPGSGSQTSGPPSDSGTSTPPTGPGVSPAPPSSSPPAPPTSPAPSPSAPAPTSSSPQRPPTTSAATPTSTSSAALAAAYEEQVLGLVNTERAKAGCSAVRADTPLRDLARAHSNDMAERDYFSHDTPDGKTPWDRASAAAVDYLAAENIARGQKTPEAVMDAWMNSPGHRRNILDCSLTKLGVGVRMGGEGPWWTQDFGR